MTAAASPFATPLSRRPLAAARGGLAFSVPARHNPRLQALVERIDADEELRELWRCANVNAADRAGLGDHGGTHARIVANAGLRLLRLLLEAGFRSSLVDIHGLSRADSEVLVVLAAALHDLGLSIDLERPAAAGLALAHTKTVQLLDGLYPVRERTILLTEVLGAISAHHGRRQPQSVEAGVLTVADVLDLSKGRVGTHEDTTGDVNAVHIQRGTRRPIRVDIRLAPGGELRRITRRLTDRLADAALLEALEFVATLPDDSAVPLDLAAQRSQNPIGA